MNTQTVQRGFTFIEVIIVTAVISLFFAGLLGAVKYTLGLIAEGREKITALTVATEQIEYIRSLSYDSVGTVSGIPSGALPQLSTTTLNGIPFSKRILIEYIDDDADGIGAADSNGITTDYKQAKVVVEWTTRGAVKELFLVSNIIPRSIETSVGGGTLRVNVFDADVQPLSGASVRVVNDTVIPNIDVTKHTDSTGVALFGGAPAGPDYEIYVTDTGYSSDQTHAVTVALPNPTTRPVAVLEADISTMNFFIDELGTLIVRTLGSKVASSVAETFADTTGILSSSQINVISGSARLEDVVGVFRTSGQFYLNTVAPSPLLKWGSVAVDGDTPTNTTALVKFYTGTTTLTLVPNAVIPGNSTGFAPGIIDISMVDISAYPALVIGVSLATTNTATTSSIDSINVSYTASESLLSGVSLTAVGAKTIGTNSGGDAVYKNTYSGSTVSGEYEFSNIEWDGYTLSASGYDISEACSANPVSVQPDSTTALDLLLTTNTPYSLRVVVETVAGVPIVDADVELTRSGYSNSIDSGVCGQSFFGGISSAIDYQVQVSVPGYATQTFSDVMVDGDEVLVVQF